MVIAADRTLPFTIVPLPAGGSASLRMLADGMGGRLVLGTRALPAAVEQYRRLAATLHHSQEVSGLKTVMVASAMPGEGKTLTAANLALTLSESYRRRVLLIDADLRRPTMHDVFQLPNISGLNELLTGASVAETRAIQVSNRLVVLPSGRPTPDPMGALGSPRMRELVASAAAGFDWVIVDTPPVGLLPDARLLATAVESVVMVISAGKVSYKLLQRAVDALGRERIAGVVLNRALDTLLASSQGSYGGYYSAYTPRE